MRRVASQQGERLPKTESLISMISRWVNSREQPDTFYQRVLSMALGMPPAALGFESWSPVIDDQGDEAWELDRALEASNVGRHALDQLQEETARFGQQYPSTLPGLMLPRVRRRLRRVILLLDGSQPSGQRRTLCTVAGQLAGLAGVLRYDLGDPVAADAYYRAGLHAASESDDAALSAYLLANQSLLRTYGGEPEEALSLLETALDQAGQTARVTSQRAWIATLTAEAHAVVGDASGCRRALHAADELLDRADMAARRQGIDFFGTARLAAYQTSCHVMLADPSAALHASDEALTMLDPAHERSRSFVLLDRATAFVQQGDLDAACDAAKDPFKFLERGPAPRLSTRGEAFRAALAPFASTRAVREFNEAFPGERKE